MRNTAIAVGTLLVSLLQTSGAADIRIRGYVYDSDSATVLSGAKAALKANGLSATTDAKGYFLIQQSTAVAPRAAGTMSMW